MIFKLYNSDAGVKINGIKYEWDHVTGVVIEDPEENKLTRGANAKNTRGIAYKQGMKDPKSITYTIMGLTPEMKQVLDDCFKKQTRCEPFVIDRDDGSSKIAEDAILCQVAQQLSLDDTPESMNVTLRFESYVLTETMKS